MLLRFSCKWTIYANRFYRTCGHFIRQNNRKNILNLGSVRMRPSLLPERSLSSDSKVVFESKSANKQQEDNDEEISPLHDMELQKFLEEIKNDFDEQPAEKITIVTEQHDDAVIKGDTGCGVEETTEGYKLSAEEFANLPLSIKEKFEQYRDEDSDIIHSAEEKPQKVATWKQQTIEVEKEELYLYQEKTDKLDSVSFERGKMGVFDIEQLVVILKQENVFDIAVIGIPPSLHYCDYMVLATTKSPRHLVAVTDFIRRLHKKHKHANEQFLKIEGEDCRDWKAIDMGHIVLHLFLPEARELYDIETLWTVGEKYDPLSNQKADSYEDLLEEQMAFLRNAEPLIDNTK